MILAGPGRAYVRDLAGGTRLYVNDEAVREGPLHTGDTVRIGRFNFCVRDANGSGDTDAQTPVINLHIGGRLRRCAGRVVLIGSRAGCDVLLPGSSTSQVHAALIWIDRKWYVRDLRSGWKTFVNSAEVGPMMELKEGDVIRIGTTEMCYVHTRAGADADVLPPEQVPVEEIAARDVGVGRADLARVWSFNELTRRLREEPRKRSWARDALRRRLLWVGLSAVAVCGAVAAVLHAFNL